MTVVKNLRVVSLGLDINRLDVFWDYVEPPRVLEYEVWVERSEGPVGPFSVIAKTYGSRSYTDWGISRSFHQQFYYRLRVVSRATAAVVETSKTTALEARKDLVVEEIRRRENLLLREYTGVPVLYYPIRNTGMRCPECWGELERQKVKSGCDSCFDTGYVTGFYTPVLVHMNIHVSRNDITQNAEVDEINTQESSAFVSGDLPIQFGDLVVEEQNTRWTISSWELTEKLRAVVSYKIELHLQQETSVFYRVPLPSENIFSLAYVNREYTRPYTLNP